MRTFGRSIWAWLWRTPVQTFILCPLAVIAFELVLHRGSLTSCRGACRSWPGATCNIASSAATGCRWPAAAPAWTCRRERIIDSGPYRYTRNPMYLGHLIFLTGLALTFWSWFALIILVARAVWFQRRVLHDEARLETIFGADYAAYRARVKRWIPGVL